MDKVSILMNVRVTVSDMDEASEVALHLKEMLDDNDIPNNITIVNET